ncbi:MAG: hypothetical protein LAT61_14940 [Alcanivorax sp.]|nr:hypothetical protein [Alcanivorax sp.]
MRDFGSMKQSYEAMGYDERLAFLSGLKVILEAEMQKIGQNYDETDSRDVRIRLLKKTSELQEAIHAVKDSSKESSKEPAVVDDGFWGTLEQYLISGVD